jgi:hypothetical protein
MTSGMMLMFKVRPRNFLLAPELAMSSSLLVRRQMRKTTPKILKAAIAPIAAIVVTVVTVTVDTIFILLNKEIRTFTRYTLKLSHKEFDLSSGGHNVGAGF